MKNISFSDLLQIPELSGFTELKLAGLENDALVLKWAYELGVDKNKGYRVIAKKHRNMRNQVVTGLILQGEIRMDEAFKDSPFCTPDDRLVIIGQKDSSLLAEVGRHSYVQTDMTQEETEKAQRMYVDSSITEKDWKEAEALLESISHAIESIRGDAYTPSGAVKKFADWQRK